jgi:hypothetical protein
MSAPTRAKRTNPVRRREANHIHLPSVHVRRENGVGFDYDEDLYVEGQRVERVIRLVIVENGGPALIRETRDLLCREELADLEDTLPMLMEEGNPGAEAVMEECARTEFARQLRIGQGIEAACAKCGCSETRACSGGCCWATETLCSRCA